MLVCSVGYGVDLLTQESEVSMRDRSTRYPHGIAKPKQHISTAKSPPKYTCFAFIGSSAAEWVNVTGCVQRIPENDILAKLGVYVQV